MVRTVISLEEQDKRWLHDEAERLGVSMTEVVRRAVHRYREEASKPSFGELLQAARGSWREGDGLEWQRSLRESWDERTA